MPDRDDDNPDWGRFAGIGLQMAAGVAIGYFIGRWFDRHYGWESRGVIIGTMLGLAGGMYLLIKDAIRINKD
jgi:F0F1-type ATP synthase assembly protein I